MDCWITDRNAFLYVNTYSQMKTYHIHYWKTQFAFKLFSEQSHDLFRIDKKAYIVHKSNFSNPIVCKKVQSFDEKMILPYGNLYSFLIYELH